MNSFPIKLQTALKMNNMKNIDLVNASRIYWEECQTKLTVSDVSNFINDVYQPSKKKLNLICKTLDLEESWLLGYQESSVNDEERILLEAWRNADESTKESVSFLLRDYGMYYARTKNEEKIAT